MSKYSSIFTKEQVLAFEQQDQQDARDWRELMYHARQYLEHLREGSDAMNADSEAIWNLIQQYLEEEDDMSESVDQFVSNVDVPPAGEVGGFDEYQLPEGDAVEKSQTAMHALRLKLASLLELDAQFEEREAEIQFARGRLKRQLREID